LIIRASGFPIESLRPALSQYQDRRCSAASGPPGPYDEGSMKVAAGQSYGAIDARAFAGRPGAFPLLRREGRLTGLRIG
jgi:hypothetical protein